MGRHLVLVPCPLQGHMSPMLQLAKLLHSKGFIITVFIFTHDQSNPSPKPSNHPEFFFQIVDGISPILDSPNVGGDVLLYLHELNEECKKPFKDRLLSKLIQSSSSPGDVSCIVYDAVMYFSADVADEVEIPRIVLRTSSVSNFLAFSLGHDHKELISKDLHNPHQQVPEFPILRAKDKPVFNTSDRKVNDEVLAGIHHATKTALAVIWNSLNCLENQVFKKVERKILSQVFPICPSLHYKRNGYLLYKGLHTEDPSCISWLETQCANSVLYVSTGSVVRVTKSEMCEMAWGLANSGQPFLWVVRPCLAEGSNNGIELLPRGFIEMTRERGKVVSWAPQQKVLAHRSVGGFWTHNGWNSTMESVIEGVPMICWPRIGDQRVNARVVSHVWKVGIELEENIVRWEVEKAIRRLLEGKEGSELRKRAMELKEKVIFSLEQGGSSLESLGKLIDYLSTVCVMK